MKKYMLIIEHRICLKITPFQILGVKRFSLMKKVSREGQNFYKNYHFLHRIYDVFKRNSSVLKKIGDGICEQFPELFTNLFLTKFYDQDFNGHNFSYGVPRCVQKATILGPFTEDV